MSRMLQLGYSMFDVQGVKCNFHLLTEAQNTIESMCSNKNSTLEQKTVACEQQITEKTCAIITAP
jgi:hypothetical protein